MEKNKINITPGLSTLVLGLGKSGMAASRLLDRLGAALRVVDSSPVANLDQEFVAWLRRKEIPLITNQKAENILDGIKLIVVSPGVPLDLSIIERAQQLYIPVVGELGLAAQYIAQPMIAVTGTNGKSTVTSLLGEFFRQQFTDVFVGGNIGIPLSEYVYRVEKAKRVILEVSSFQLDTIHYFRPAAAILLNISPDHLDRYDDYNHYADSKMRIFQDQKEEDMAILNADDPDLMMRKGMVNGTPLLFSTQKKDTDAWLENGIVHLNFTVGDEHVQELYTVPEHLKEGPNPINVMAAILAARSIGCSSEAITKGLSSFQLLSHRMTPVATVGGVNYIDDSKATNIGALKAALEAVQKPVILIAGGRDKGGDYLLLKDVIAEKVKAMIVIGEAKEAMMQSYSAVVSIDSASDLEEAVMVASNRAVAGDIVLLSPACASFDMFKSYAERGLVYQKAVRQLALKKRELW